MEQIILNILEALRRGETVDDRALVKLIHAEARREGADKRDLAKRRLLPFYQRVKREKPARWAGWNVDAELERQLLQVLRMKPRRTASGVATITVINQALAMLGRLPVLPQRPAHAQKLSARRAGVRPCGAELLRPVSAGERSPDRAFADGACDRQD